MWEGRRRGVEWRAMTIEAGERASDRTNGGGHVSGSVICTLVELTRSRAGESGVAQVLALADDRRDFARLGDRHHWSSLEQTVALFNAASLVIGDQAVALHVGSQLLAGDAELAGDLRALGSPAAAFGRIHDVLAFFDDTATAATAELEDERALVRVRSRSGTDRRDPHLCEMTRGLLTSLPTVLGRPPALVTESECAARGGRFCLYAATWDADAPAAVGGTGAASEVPASDQPVAPVVDIETERAPAGRGVDGGEEPAPTEADDPVGRVRPTDDEEPTPTGGHGRPDDASLARLESALRQMDTLFEDALATTLELLDDDADALLGHIATRADSVVSAGSYVLAIRVAPGAPVRVHARGLEAEDASTVATELWREQPDSHDPRRLVVDIASPRRHYGRMAVLLPADARPDPGEVHLLNLYAAYAAAALDVHAVLADAQRHDATTRALLSFSERLSQITDLGEAVQLVVDVVPGVTGCDRATIYLWDDRLGHLVPRARTTGRGDGSFAGGFAVTGRPVRPTTSGSGSVPAPKGPAPSDDRPAPDDAAVGPDDGHGIVVVPTNRPLMDQLVNRREVILIEKDVDDPALRRLLADNGSEATVVAPLFTSGQLLGTLSASFALGTPAATYRDPDVHDRLAGFADKAAIAFQNLDLLEKISHMAWHDALTGLPNRRLFEDRVNQELIRSRRVGEPVCMFFVDLDRFKGVNDMLGHAIGDELIQRVSDRLVEVVRAQDTVARVGGDEFAILLPGLADQLDIDQLAGRTLEAVAQPFHLSGEEVRTTASVGIAVAPDHGDSYDELLSRADEAMYRAKALGRDGFQMYSAARDERSELDERSIYRDLVHALGSDQFFVVYQPYVDLRTTEVLGVEALLRWRHPDHGVLQPADFVPIAERSDAIVALDTWVLAEACRQLRRWDEAGLPSVRLAVNLSSRDLESPDYPKIVARILSDTGVDPDRLELDITERVEVDETGPARTTIDRLRRLGVHFTVDDFGTANSSLSRLGVFPVSTLKIDRSFVQVLAPGGDTDELVSAIVDMADRLGLECVAEGVETPLQSRVLLQRGCTTAQGYFLCPPLSPDELEAALTVVTAPDGHPDQGLPG